MKIVRRAAVLAAILTVLGTAQSAPAGILGVKVSASVDKANGARVSVAAPPAAADVAVSTSEVSARVEAPPVGLDVTLRKGTPSVSKAPGGTVDRSARNPKPRPRKPAAAPDVAVAAESPRSNRGDPAQPPIDPTFRSFPPELAPAGASSSLAAPPIGSAGAPAALAGIVLVVVALLSWTAVACEPRVRPPLLSFALERPG